MIKIHVVVDSPKWKKKIKNLKNYFNFKQKKFNNFNLSKIKKEFTIFLTSNYKMKYLNYKFRKIINLGFKDSFRLFNNKDKQYTFWDYTQGSWQRNKGLRIDHFLVTDKISTKIKKVEIDKFTRGLNKPSDHAPIRVIF